MEQMLGSGSFQALLLLLFVLGIKRKALELFRPFGVLGYRLGEAAGLKRYSCPGESPALLHNRDAQAP